MTSPATWDGSNCTDVPADGFYPEKGTAQITAREAKKVCNGEDGRHAVCRWRAQCLDYALMRGERHGVWGGMSERDRHKEKRRRKAEYEASLAPVINIRTKQQEPAVPEKADRYVAKTRKAAAAPPAPRKATGMLGRFAETKKAKQLLLPTVQQHLLGLPQGEDRSHHLLHVSELAKSDFCARAAYLRIKSVRAGRPFTEETPHFTLDNIYAEGDRIHEKWQTWFWNMGVLWGMYYCTACGIQFWTTSPKVCDACGAHRGALRFGEVAMEDEKNLITGHADGEIRNGSNYLLEVKSIGVGTVRVEAPKMLMEYTRKYKDESGTNKSYVDHDALWRDLRRPFPAHLRQGVIYLYLRGLMTELYDWPSVSKIVFIYEYKPTQAVKEFSIGPDEEWIAEVLESCKDVVYALDNDEAPTCKNGRREHCKKCKSFDDKDSDAEHKVEARRGNGARESKGGEPVAVDAPETERRTRIARRPNRSGRQRADVVASSPHTMGGLLRRAASDGGGRRANG